jgi:hypothetical protein
MCDIPPHSHLEILGLPEPNGASDIECYGLNAGDEGEHGHLEVYGGLSFRVGPNDESGVVSRLRLAFPATAFYREGSPRTAHVSTRVVGGEILANLYLNLKFADVPHTLVREAVIPFVEAFRRLAKPFRHAFICHASEDKTAARALASAMTQLGTAVWLDEWEIRVGESIVQKVNSALGKATHLIVLLSNQSVRKPWVQRELSSALMRQLSQNSIRVLPVRLDDCAIPPILADIKYADAREGMDRALADLEKGLFAESELDEDA